MNTDGSGWSMATRTSYSTTGGIRSLQLQVNDSYIYYVWTKSYSGENRITTAKMNVNGAGWAAVQRTSGTLDYQVQQHVFDGNIYYIFYRDVYPTEPNYQIRTAKMTADGAGWISTQRATSDIRPYPQLDIVENKLQYVYLRWPNSRPQIYTAIMNLDGSGWVANERTITTDDYKSEPQLDELNYAWIGDKGGNWYAQVWLSVPITVATGDPTEVEVNSANGFGVVQTGDDVKRRGFCWNTTGNPTVDDDNVIEYNVDFGTGNFSLAMTELEPGTKYYVRAFAYDVDYIYGDQVEFTTKLAAPTNVQVTDGAHADKVVVTWTKSIGATGYQVYRDDVALGWLGDVATYDDTGADAPTITHGSITASDGTYITHIALSNTGASTNNGTTHIYKVRARNATVESDDSETDTGYRGVGSLTYQWYRSAGDSDANYSVISGATASTYNDTDAPAGGVPGAPTGLTATDGDHTDKVTLTWTNVPGASEGRYYKCYHTATGATSDYTGVNRGYRGAYTSTNTQVKRDTTELDAIGSLATSYDDTEADTPTITPGTASASDGTSSEYVTLSLAGESANSGTAHNYYVRTYNVAGWGNWSSVNTGYRGVGALTYQWQRSSADSDADYSNIDGATTDPYNDTGAPEDRSGRYYKCVEDATGATQQISAVDRGYRTQTMYYRAYVIDAEGNTQYGEGKTFNFK